MASGCERTCCLKNLKGAFLAVYIILRVLVNVVLGAAAFAVYYLEFASDDQETTTAPSSTRPASPAPSSTAATPSTKGPYSPYNRARRSTDEHYQDPSNQFGWIQAGSAVGFLVTVYVIQRLILLWCAKWAEMTGAPAAGPTLAVEGAVHQGTAPPCPAPPLQADTAHQEDNSLDNDEAMDEEEHAIDDGVHGPFHIYGRDRQDVESIDMSSLDNSLNREYAEIADFDSIPDLSNGTITSSEEDIPGNIFSGDQIIRSFQAERDNITREVRQSMHLLGLLGDALDSRIRILDRRWNGPSPSDVYISLRSMNTDANEDARREMEHGEREQEGGEGGRERETAGAGGAAGDHGENGTFRGEADGSTFRTTTI